MKHIDAVAELASILTSKAGFYNQLRSGMLCFCWGRAAISDAIERATGGPSHILLVWSPIGINEWLTIEATKEKGVHVGLLTDYIEGYDGDIVICSRINPDSGELVNMAKTIDAELRVLDQGYATFGLLQNGAHRLVSAIPANCNLTQKYCSGLQQYGGQVSAVPFAKTDGAATPEDLWCDPTTVARAGLLKGTQ